MIDYLSHQSVKQLPNERQKLRSNIPSFVHSDFRVYAQCDAEHAGILTEAGAEGAPDFVVEILSPKTRQLDLINKKRLYATRGVRELWVIDPETRVVTIHRFAEGGRESISEVAESGVLITSLLPGFKVPALLLYER